MIRTGLEREDDWDDFLNTLEEMLKIRDEVGANTAFQFSFTPLVVYDNIPLRYEPRITAQQSFEDVRNMGSVLDRVHALADKYNAYIKVKFNGRGPGTFLEQMLLDGGRTLTRVIVRMCLDDNLDYQRNFSDPHKESLVKWCNYYGIDFKDIFRERDVDEIFWSDSIQFVTEKRLKEWHDQHINHNYSHGYCLDTNSSKGKCYGCGTCPSGAAIKSITNRDLTHMSVDEAISNMAGERVRSITRMVVSKSDDWKIYSNETLCHYVASLFLQEDEELVKAFHMVSKNNTFWVSDNDQKDWFSGYVVLDIKWKDLITAERLRPLIEKVNEKLHIAKVLEVYDISDNLLMTTKCNMTYMSDWEDIPIGRVTERINNFDWEVKVVEKDSQMPVVKKKYMPELKSCISVIPVGKGVRCTMTLPAQINPHYVMSSILGIPESVCREYCFRTIDVGTPSDIVCKQSCGHYANYSAIFNKQRALCPVCEAKVRLMKSIK